MVHLFRLHFKDEGSGKNSDDSVGISDAKDNRIPDFIQSNDIKKISAIAASSINSRINTDSFCFKGPFIDIIKDKNVVIRNLKRQIKKLEKELQTGIHNETRDDQDPYLHRLRMIEEKIKDLKVQKNGYYFFLKYFQINHYVKI